MGGGGRKAGEGDAARLESGWGAFIMMPRSSDDADESLSYLADCAIAMVPRLRALGRRAWFACLTAGRPRPHLHSTSLGGGGAEVTLMRRQRHAVVAVESVKSTQSAMLRPQMDLICRQAGLLGSTHS